MDAASSSEMSIRNYQLTQFHIPEEWCLRLCP